MRKQKLFYEYEKTLLTEVAKKKWDTIGKYGIEKYKKMIKNIASLTVEAYFTILKKVDPDDVMRWMESIGDIFPLASSRRKGLKIRMIKMDLLRNSLADFLSGNVPPNGYIHEDIIAYFVHEYLERTFESRLSKRGRYKKIDFKRTYDYLMKFLGNNIVNDAVVYIVQDFIRGFYRLYYSTKIKSSDKKVMRLLDPRTGVMRCKVCGSVNWANVRPNSGGKYYRLSWECLKGCTLNDLEEAK